MSIAPENAVRRIVTDAELLLWAVAGADLPAGLRIIDIGRASISGVAIGSGHGLAHAHRLRPGVIAVGVALEALAEDVIGLGCAGDDAAFAIEAVAAHELAHALVAPADGERSPAYKQALRDLPALVAALSPSLGEPDKEARDHDERWAAAFVAIVRRCIAVRPLERAAWAACLKADLRRYGIDADAVAEALGDIPAEASLRELLAEGGPVAERVARAVPSLSDRIAVIADHQFSPAEPGHVAPVGAGAVSVREGSIMIVDVLNLVRSRQQARASGAEGLARRLANGENVPIEEVEAILTRTGCTVDELRERVACLERRDEKHREIAAGAKAEKRLAKIQAEIDDARAVLADALAKLEAIQDRHAADIMQLEHAKLTAAWAKDSLLTPANLSPAQRAKLAEARQAYADAEGAEAEARDGIPVLRATLERLEANLAEALDDRRANPENGDIRDRCIRYESAIKVRRRTLKEAEDGLKAMQAAAEDARKACRAVENEMMQ
jgi:hypothetical protein